MCQKRSSVIAELTPNKSIRCDSCIRHLIESMHRHGFETVGCCCGHGIYPMTIVCKSKTGDNRYYDVVSGKVIPRTRNFYKKDSEGYYYIPEVSKLKEITNLIRIDEVYSLDWSHILLDAINSRETSWGHIKKAMIEYRNAGDCLAGAVIAEMRKKGLMKER